MLRLIFVKPNTPAAAKRKVPTIIIGLIPYFEIRLLVKKLGKYIDNACAVTIFAASEFVYPHPITANGVEVITRFIREYAIIAQTIAVRVFLFFKNFSLFNLYCGFGLRFDVFGALKKKNKNTPIRFIPTAAK